MPSLSPLSSLGARETRGAPLAFLSRLKLPFPSLSNACHLGKGILKKHENVSGSCKGTILAPSTQNAVKPFKQRFMVYTTDFPALSMHVHLCSDLGFINMIRRLRLIRDNLPINLKQLKELADL